MGVPVVLAFNRISNNMGMLRLHPAAGNYTSPHGGRRPRRRGPPARGGATPAPGGLFPHARARHQKSLREHPHHAKGLIEGAHPRQQPRASSSSMCLLLQTQRGETALEGDYICARRPGGGGAQAATVTIPHLLAHCVTTASRRIQQLEARGRWELIDLNQPSHSISDDHALHPQRTTRLMSGGECMKNRRHRC